MASCLISESILDSLPSELELIFAGESAHCAGLLADVNVKNDVAQVDEEAIVRAVAESFALVKTDKDSAIATASATAQTVLEVTAKAVATIDAKVNSPNPGCWALVFGRAEAVAIAQAVVTAVAEGIAQASGNENLAAEAFARASNTEASIAEAVAVVALLLVRGDGSGISTAQATAVAEARARAVNCALAQAYAEVFEGSQAEAAAIVQVGCPPAADTRSIFSSVPAAESGCACKTWGRQAPNNCAPWGGADNICYVENPSACSCAQESLDFPGEKWRFCGGVLGDMQKYLSFESPTYDVYSTTAGYGYCDVQPWQDDVVVEIPNPVPSPQPATSIGKCPVFSCIGSRRLCCDLNPSETCTAAFRQHSYAGQCDGELDVWEDELGFKCVCN